mgnify:CR=1 FL=1
MLKLVCFTFFFFPTDFALDVSVSMIAIQAVFINEERTRFIDSYWVAWRAGSRRCRAGWRHQPSSVSIGVSLFFSSALRSRHDMCNTLFNFTSSYACHVGRGHGWGQYRFPVVLAPMTSLTGGRLDGRLDGWVDTWMFGNLAIHYDGIWTCLSLLMDHGSSSFIIIIPPAHADIRTRHIERSLDGGWFVSSSSPRFLESSWRNHVFFFFLDIYFLQRMLEF